MAARELLAKAYSDKGQYRSGIAQLINVFGVLEAKVGNRETKFRILNNIGAMYLNDKNGRSAETWLERATMMAEGLNPIAHHNLARVYLQDNNPRKAVAVLQDARKYFPGNAETESLMAFCFIRLELYDEAIDTLTAALARDIRSAAIYSRLVATMRCKA